MSFSKTVLRNKVAGKKHVAAVCDSCSSVMQLQQCVAVCCSCSSVLQRVTKTVLRDIVAGKEWKNRVGKMN